MLWFRSILAVLIIGVLLGQLIMLRKLSRRSGTIADIGSYDVPTNHDKNELKSMEDVAIDDEDESPSPSTHWNAMIRAAEASNYTCENSTRPTSIRATLRSNGNLSLSLSSQYQHHNEQSNEWPFVSIDLTFRAYDEDSRPQASGGDVFVVDYQSYWTEPMGDLEFYVVVRTAAFARDNLDGTYTATRPLPRARPPSREHTVRVSLRHYAACHEGLQLPPRLMKRKSISSGLRFGPLPWDKAAEDVRSFLADLPPPNGTIETKGVGYDNRLPECSEAAHREDILRGVWTETQLKPPSSMDMTKEATWHPFRCRLGWPRGSAGAHHFRVGDSSMAQRTVEVGMPYQPWNGRRDYALHQSRFMDFLRDQIFRYNRTFGPYDTLIFGGGLHHIQHGRFDVPSAVRLVVRSLCQLALALPGIRLMLKGPNPIQQHRYRAVDQTSLNARRINWELRSTLRKAENKIEDMCGSIPLDEITSFIALAGDKGNVLRNEDAAPFLVQRYNYSWERDSSADQKKLVTWMRGLSPEQRVRRYGNRTVEWVDLEEFLLPRSDVYRDKIHDGVRFAQGHHSNLLSHVEGDLDKCITTARQMQHKQ